MVAGMERGLPAEEQAELLSVPVLRVLGAALSRWVLMRASLSLSELWRLHVFWTNFFLVAEIEEGSQVPTDWKCMYAPIVNGPNDSR